MKLTLLAAALLAVATLSVDIDTVVPEAEFVDQLAHLLGAEKTASTPSKLPAKTVVKDIEQPSDTPDALDNNIKKDFPKDKIPPGPCETGPFVSSDAKIDPTTKVYGKGECSRRRIGAGFGRRRAPPPAPTPPPTPKPLYVHSKEIACPAGYDKIYNDKVCGEAAEALNLPIAGPERPKTNIPKHYHACQFAGGCAVDDKFQKQNKGKVVYNLDKSERCDKGFQMGQAVCQLKAPPVAPTATGSGSGTAAP